MKVKELIAKLQQMDQDATVVVSETFEVPVGDYVECYYQDSEVTDIYAQSDGTVKIDIY